MTEEYDSEYYRNKAAALLSEASSHAEKRGRNDIIEDLSHAFDWIDQAGTDEDLAKISNYAHRMYARLASKFFDDTMPVNRVSQTFNHDFLISNYSYDMYEWAWKKGLGEWISNLSILVPYDKLSEAEVASFERRSSEHDK